jgi:DNA ligase-1
MVPHINRELFELPWGSDFEELDGEFYKHGMRHEDIRSIVSRTVDIHPDYSDIEYHIFDYPGGAITNYERNHYLQRLSGSEKVKIVKTKLCSTLLEVEEAYREFLDHGYEGIVIRNPMGLYKRSRSTDLMKLKPRQELEAFVEAVFQQKDKNGVPKNALGGVLCYHFGSDRKFEVGTGFTKEEREQFWAHPELILGKLIEVEFQDWTDTSIKMQSYKRIVDNY